MNLPWQAMAALGILLIAWVCAWALLRSSAQREQAVLNEHCMAHATDAPGFAMADGTDVGRVESSVVAAMAERPDRGGLPPGIHPVYFWPGEEHRDFEVIA